MNKVYNMRNRLQHSCMKNSLYYLKKDSPRSKSHRYSMKEKNLNEYCFTVCICETKMSKCRYGSNLLRKYQDKYLWTKFHSENNFKNTQNVSKNAIKCLPEHQKIDERRLDNVVNLV